MISRRSFLGGLAAAVAAVLLPKARTVEAQEAGVLSKRTSAVMDNLGIQEQPPMSDLELLAQIERDDDEYWEPIIQQHARAVVAEMEKEYARQLGKQPPSLTADEKRQALECGMRNKTTADLFYQNASTVTFYKESGDGETVVRTRLSGGHDRNAVGVSWSPGCVFQLADGRVVTVDMQGQITIRATNEPVHIGPDGTIIIGKEGVNG